MKSFKVNNESYPFELNIYGQQEFETLAHKPFIHFYNDNTSGDYYLKDWMIMLYAGLKGGCFSKDDEFPYSYNAFVKFLMKEGYNQKKIIKEVGVLLGGEDKPKNELAPE